jgi:formate dehydrogenase assembly factor FdhD
MIFPQKAIHYERYEFKKWKPFDAETIVESPVSLTVNGQVGSSMCTPVNLEAMSIGFATTKASLVNGRGGRRAFVDGDNMDVWLNHGVEQLSWQRTSGCTGGVTAVDAARGRFV